MNLSKRFRLMAEGDGGGGGGAAVADAPAPAPAPAAPAPAPAAPSPAPAAPAPSPAPAAPSPVPAPAAPAPAPSASLLKPPPKPGEAPAPAPAADASAMFAKVPEKFRVSTADGKPDVEATLAKLTDSYTNLEKLKGPALPASPSDYKFQPPEKFKDLPTNDAATNAFREKAHKAGFTQEQFEFAMSEYFDLVPGVLDAAAKHTAEEARAELQKVWKSEAEFDAGLAAAQRAIDNAPEAIRNDVWERFGRDPAFLQFAASIGKEMQEDRPPQNPDGGTGANATVEALMASKAYRDPKDPKHAAVSAQVNAHFQRTRGDSPVM